MPAAAFGRRTTRSHPLLLTTVDPTPTDLPGLTVLDVGYEYNINGDAPIDPFNPFTLGNSLAAYAYGYGQESTALNITQAAEWRCNPRSSHRPRRDFATRHTLRRQGREHRPDVLR